MAAVFVGGTMALSSHLVVRAAFISVLIFLATMIACSTAPASDPQPVMEWKVIRDETFVVGEGSAMTGAFVPKDAERFSQKIEIHAQSPIAVVFFPERYRDAVLSSDPAITSDPIFSCFKMHIIQATLQCPLETSAEGYYLLIRDERPPARTGGFLDAMGMRKPTIRNDVTVRQLKYMCVANCASL